MKKIAKKNNSEIQAEYDFSRGIRGKYARGYAEGLMWWFSNPMSPVLSRMPKR